MNILASHAALWHNDRWYRRAWYIWPQTISLLLIGWLFVGELPKPPEPPWAPPPPKPAPPPRPVPPRQPDDEIICWVQNSSPGALNACNRLIDKGHTGFYF